MEIIRRLRRHGKRSLAALGYEIRRRARPGSVQRPVGDMQVVLEDIRQRGFAPSVILDIGAHRAAWSRLAKAVFPGADLFMIEPQSEMEPHLQGFCAEHPGSKYFLVGAGSVSGKVPLTLQDNLAGSSFLPAASEELHTTGYQRPVPMVTVDELIASNQMPVPQLAKLDVQGYELEVLRGGELLLGHVEVFVMETSLYRFFPNMPLFHEVVAYMAKQHYVIYDLPGYARRPLDGALGQIDVCFVHNDSTLRKSDEWK